MAGAIEGSFSLEDFEANVLENAAAMPNRDKITVCKCRGHCLREKGRNFCPCRSINSLCSSACHGEDFGCCMNNRLVQESDSDESDSEFTIEESENEGEQQLQIEKRGRGRGRGQGRGQGTASQRRGRGGSGRGRGRGRGSGRGRLLEEPNIAENQADHEQHLVDLVEAMNIDNLRRLALELLRRQPAAFADIVNGELVSGNEPQPPNPEPDNDAPDWCKCGCCIIMPTQEENKCCTRSRRPCISRTNLFSQLILDGNVLEISMRYREDVLVLNNVRNNENFRHAAYRQYVLWQHGRLGRGNRRVVPSCCVVAIRNCYPSPNGQYRGYLPAVFR
ncbi:uncharacterized protein LOC114519475 [Dendronephthya gigantea]|uniref:uncharacterized protein LOC114519475 n=1 Tax=Dendronephthya gigantea TaxID=151771 RepID=UPI00106B571D|nr:uncharacterized protein LOC114519475 [Dendronephthya gigantea]